MSALIPKLVAVINRMRTIADDLYKHNYDSSMKLPRINRELIRELEDLLRAAEDTEENLAESLVSYAASSEGDLKLLPEYLMAQEERNARTRRQTRGKVKYFKKFHRDLANALEQ